MANSGYVKRPPIPHLTGVRAIAAYLVLVSHSADTTFAYGQLDSVAHKYVVCLAHLGMSLFFVLSGFVITYGYYDRFVRLPWRQAARDFAVARFARLYPLYITFLLCSRQNYKPLFRHATWPQKLSYFTLTQSWWNVQWVTFRPAWSISTECFFYLCFALYLIRRPRRTASIPQIRRNAILLSAGCFPLLAALFAKQTEVTAFLSALAITGRGDVWNWFTYASPYVRLGEFILGSFAARMYMLTQHSGESPSGRRHSGLFSLCCLAAIAILAIGDAGLLPATSFLPFLAHNFGWALFLAYLLYASSRHPNLLTRLCSTHAMQGGGEISYSVYIVQFWIFSNVLPQYVAYVPSTLAYAVSLLKLLLYLVVTTVAATCTYRIIEVPGKRMLRKWLSPKFFC